MSPLATTLLRIRRGRNKNFSFRSEVVLLIFITILCAIPRIILLSSIPTGLHGDEAWTGLDAIRILKEGYIGPYVPGALGEPSGPIYFTALIFKLFGESIFTLRLSMAIFGIITIPLFYIFLRLFFQKFVSSLGTLFLGMSLIHIHYSRIGFKVASAPVFAILTLIFIIRAEKHKKNIDIALAGLFCGLGLYSYNAFAVFPIIILVFLLIRVFASRFSTFHIKRFIIFTAVFLLSGFLLINFIIQNPNAYLSHFKTISITNAPAYKNASSLFPKITLILDNGLSNLKHFFVGKSIDYSDGFNKYRTFDLSTIILFLIGFIILCIRVLKKRKFVDFLLLVSFIILLSLGSSGSWGSHRRQIIPSVYIFFFVTLTVDFLRKIKNSITRKISLAIITIILLFNSVDNLKIYFQKFANDDDAKWVYAYQLEQASSFLHFLPQPLYTYFYSNRWSYQYETLRFLARTIPGEDRSTQFGTYSLVNNHLTNNVVYVFLPEYSDSFHSVQRLYPNGEAVTKKDKNGSILFFAYIVPKQL